MNPVYWVGVNIMVGVMFMMMVSCVVVMFSVQMSGNSGKSCVGDRGEELWVLISS